MAQFELTTTARFKTFKRDTGSRDDDIIDLLVPALSGEIERFLDRHLLQAERTEYFDVRPGQQRFHLRGYPIDTGQTFEVRNDVNNDFPASSVVASDNYFVDAEAGLLAVNQQALDPGVRALRVQYTGGLVADQAAVTSDYPQLEMAIWVEIAQALQRNPNFGAISRSVGGGSLTVEGAIDLLPLTKRVLGHLRYTGT